MNDHTTRCFAGDLSVRADASGRTVAGLVVPFDVVARVSDGGKPYDEKFVRGSFKRTLDRGASSRVKLLLQHDHAEPIGRATLLREDAAGLYGEFAISKVSAGDEALELVRDGVIDSFSVGFAKVKERQEGRVTVRTEVALREASLVTFPAYEDARVAGIRAALAEMSDAERAELLAMIGQSTDLVPADGHSDPAPSVTDPASATRDVSIIKQYQHLRRLARENGALA